MNKFSIIFLCSLFLSCGGDETPSDLSCNGEETKCIDDAVYTCKDNNFILYDDCAAKEERCSVFNGDALCYIEHGDTDTDVDTDADSDSDTDTDCVPNAYKGCYGDDVHWFDSCGNAQSLIIDCPDIHGKCTEIEGGKAICECKNYWTGDDCNTCPDERDPYSDCLECKGDWFGDNCDEHPEIFSMNHLFWQRTSEIQKYKYEEAVSYCQALNIAGVTNWRVPNIDELKLLVDGCPAFAGCRVSEENNDGQFGGEEACSIGCSRNAYEGPGENGCYWYGGLLGSCNRHFYSSTNVSGLGHDNAVWVVYFNAAKLNLTNPLEDNFVRCVKDK